MCLTTYQTYMSAFWQSIFELGVPGGDPHRWMEKGDSREQEEKGGTLEPGGVPTGCRFLFVKALPPINFNLARGRR